MGEDTVINPGTGNLDIIGQSTSDVTDNDARYLRLFQGTAQTVTGGTPSFNGGIIIKSGQKLIFDGA